MVLAIVGSVSGVFVAFAFVVALRSRRRDAQQVSAGEKPHQVGDPTAVAANGQAMIQSQIHRIGRAGFGGR